MATIQFTDNSAQVKAALDGAIVAYLYEAAGELEAQTKRNTRVDTGNTKSSWSYHVDEAAGKAVAPITETALRPDTKNPAPDKGGINPQIRGVRRFRIRNGVPCRKQPQDTGRAWRTLRMAGEGCQLQNVDSASCITATFCI